MTTTASSPLTMLRYWVYRLRIVIMMATAGIVAITITLAFFELPSPFDASLTSIASFALTVTAITLAVAAFGPPSTTSVSRVLRAPVAGRWLALNSPATQVPSHGVRMYGQSHAIDLIAQPQQRVVDAPQPTVMQMKPASTFSSFGRPVLAMVSGTVVAASDWRRDHRSRTGPLSQIFLVVESLFRLIGGPGWVIGNHITIRTDDGTYALVAHVQRRSLRVSRGDRVTAGQRIASCGNSGNSSEPHVHAQLMDHASPWIAQGLPMCFSPAEVASSEVSPVPTQRAAMETAEVMPATGEVLLAPESPPQG